VVTDNSFRARLTGDQPRDQRFFRRVSPGKQAVLTCLSVKSWYPSQKRRRTTLERLHFGKVVWLWAAVLSAWPVATRGQHAHVEKDELFPEGDPLEGEKFTVSKVSLGYIYDFPRWGHLKAGVGGAGSIHLLPSSREPAYGDTPLSFLLFVRAKL
jgi:hypothetical protein